MFFRILKYCSLFFTLTCSVLLYGQKQSVPDKDLSVKEKSEDVLQQGNNDLKKNEREIKNSFSIKEDSIKIRDQFKVDSVGISYENGQLVLPDKISDLKDGNLKNIKERGPQLQNRTLEKEKIAEGISDNKEVLKEGLSKKSLPSAERGMEVKDKIQDQYDSIKNAATKGVEVFDQLKDGIPDTQKIYSSKGLKKLYDSLGISRIDSVLAMAANKKEVSKEELLQALDLSFPASPMESLSDKPTDQLAGLKDDVTVPDLSSMKLPFTELQQLPPIRGFQLPTDSLPFLDSLRRLSMMREKFNVREGNVTEKIKSSVIKEKPSFWDKTYMEGLVSFVKEKDLSVIQFSPSLGYHIGENMSLGLGPSIEAAKVEDKKWNATIGYRSFIKYEMFAQRTYLQFEDLVSPQAIHNEYFKRTRHSVLAGGGYLLPIAKTVAINFSLLYRVNNNSYSDGEASPWVIRVGLSSMKSKK